MVEFKVYPLYKFRIFLWKNVILWDNNDIVSTKIYDKHDDFDFEISLF